MHQLFCVTQFTLTGRTIGSVLQKKRYMLSVDYNCINHYNDQKINAFALVVFIIINENKQETHDD